MRKSLKRQALEAITLSMAEVKGNLQISGYADDVAANAKAMKDLAIACSIVKRGVMLPDYLEDKQNEN